MALTPELKMRKATLRLEKRRLSHETRLAYLDRGLALVNPIVTSPVAALLAAFVVIDYAEGHSWGIKPGTEPGGLYPPHVGSPIETDTILGPTAANTLRIAITGGFVANAFGGPVSQIIGAVK